MELKKGYKQTDIGVIPEDWEIREVKKMAPLQRGFDLPSTQLREGNYPVVYSNGILNHHISYKAKAPGVVTGRSGTIGKVTFVNENYWPHNTSLWVTNFHGNYPKYIYYLYVFLKLERFSTGSGVPTLNRNDVHSFRVAISTLLREQTAIANAISDVEELISTLEQLIAKKRNIKQGTMQELLTGKKRLKGFSGEWKVRRLEEIAEIYQPQTISQYDFTAEGYPVYGANGIVGKYDKYNHESWQTIITCRGSTCGTVNRTVNKCWITGNAMVINVDGNKNIDKPFLYFVLSKQDFTKCITGSGQPQIVRAPLSEFRINIPINIPEQQALASVLNDMDMGIEKCEQQLAKYRQIKQGMMQVLLTGKTRLV